MTGLVAPVAVVTGASSGIGRATAERLSAGGFRIALLGRDADRLGGVCSQLAGDGHRSFVVDFARAADPSEILLDVASGMGQVSALVHAAGQQSVRPVRRVTSGGVAELVSLNLTASLLLAKAFRQPAVRAERGSIVFIASVLGLVGQPGSAVYSATKAGLLGATRSLALELAAENLRVNAVCPGLVQTPMAEHFRRTAGTAAFDRMVAAHPLGLGRPEDVAAAAAFLVSDDAAWITGSTLTVDGGYTAR